MEQVVGKEKHMKRLLSVTALLSGLVLVTAVYAQSDQGKELFKKKICAACHGPGKKGGDLKDCKHDKATLVKLIKDPKSVNPKATMPAIKATDAEASALADYVMSLRK